MPMRAWLPLAMQAGLTPELCVAYALVRSRMLRITVARLLLLVSIPAAAQRMSGELRLLVMDSTGAPVEAGVHLVGDATGVDREFRTDPTGRYTARSLPFGK